MLMWATTHLRTGVKGTHTPEFLLGDVVIFHGLEDVESPGDAPLQVLHCCYGNYMWPIKGGFSE